MVEAWNQIVLPARNRQITQDRISGDTIPEIMVRYGLSRSAVVKIIREGLNRRWPTGSIDISTSPAAG